MADYYDRAGDFQYGTLAEAPGAEGFDPSLKPKRISQFITHIFVQV